MQILSIPNSFYSARDLLRTSYWTAAESTSSDVNSLSICVDRLLCRKVVFVLVLVLYLNLPIIIFLLKYMDLSSKFLIKIYTRKEPLWLSLEPPPPCDRFTSTPLRMSTLCNIQSFDNHLLFTCNDPDLHIENHLEAYNIFTNTI